MKEVPKLTSSERVVRVSGKEKSVGRKRRGKKVEGDGNGRRLRGRVVQYAG